MFDADRGMLAQLVERSLQAISIAADEFDIDGFTREQATRKFFRNDGQFSSASGKHAMKLCRLLDAEAFEYAAYDRLHTLWRIVRFVKSELRIDGRLFHATTMRAMGSLSQGKFSGSLARAYAWE
jgi:hypothetical protein